MLSEKPLRKADIITGVILLILSAAIIIEALQMPIGGTFAGVENTWYVSPASFPLIIGSLLAVCAVYLIVRAVKLEGAKDFFTYCLSQIRSSLTHPAGRKLVIIIGLLLSYIAFLSLHWFDDVSNTVQRLSLHHVYVFRYLATPEGANYFSSSVIFLFAFTQYFHRPAGGLKGWKRHALLSAISVLFPFLMGFLFSEYLKVPLP